MVRGRVGFWVKLSKITDSSGRGGRRLAGADYYDVGLRGLD
jgi:hypothetical protein